MFETAQPQAEPANQPEDISAQESSYGEQVNEEREQNKRGSTPDEPFVTVRYNKRDKPLSYEEAVIYAQKGMNYDKLSERLRDTSAKLSEYEGAGRTETKAAACEDEKQEAVNGQLESFMRSNPGMDPRALPEAVISAWKKGIPLTEAYLMYRSDMLSAKISGMEKAAAQADANRSNETASMGGAVGSGAARGKAINEESIKGMTAEELDKNHDRIWAYLTGKSRR